MISSAMLFLCALLTSTLASDERDALANQATIPPDQRWRYYYVTTAAGHPGDPDKPDVLSEQAKQAIALKFTLPSVSRQTVLEKCGPLKIGPTLYRIDLADLYWDRAAWLRFITGYPYSDAQNPIMLRADWLVTHLMDANEQTTPAYYELLFGRVPKDRDDALKLLGVMLDPAQQWGWIEGRSAVSVVGTRWIANLPVGRGYAWGTRDALKLDREHDMMESPEGGFKHDGEEWIIGIEKKHQKTGTRGVFQVYFLANGAGQLVQRADIRLVVDHTKFRGLQEIRIAGSCVQCHVNGLNPQTVDELRLALTSGVYAQTDYKNKDKIETFHFGSPKKDIRRANEDFGAMVELQCGVKPAVAVAAFASTVRSYDRALTPARAAWELGVERDELGLALGHASAHHARLPERIAGLGHGLAAPRLAFEPAHNDLRYKIIPDWSASRSPAK
jgi:hypothetical protein